MPASDCWLVPVPLQKRNPGGELLSGLCCILRGAASSGRCHQQEAYEELEAEPETL